MSTYFTLEALPARKGDCLLLHYGSKSDPRLAVIDGGPSKVYRPHLKPRLQEIRKARGLADTQPLPLDMVMVSHIDDDHIRGILEMTGELTKAKQEQKPRAWDIQLLWHNSFDSIIGNTPEQLEAAVGSQFGTASLSGSVPADADPAVPNSNRRKRIVGYDAAKVLASVGQGHKLRADARKLDLTLERSTLNAPFGELVIADGQQGSQVALGGDLDFTVVGPMKTDLEKLQKKYDKELKKRGLDRSSGAAALAAFSDPSVANLSSIVVLARSGSKSMLLTGDARGDKILKGLKNAGLIESRGRMNVDILKLPHHGSENNVTAGFFKRIHAQHYIGCGNGKHGNPEREAFEMLFKARGKSAFDIHLTYPVAKIDKERKKEANKDHQRGRRERAWDKDRDGLKSLFEQKKASGAKFRLHEPDDRGRIAIDLRAPVEF